MTAAIPLIEILRAIRPGFFHTVDPFKVSTEEACRKAAYLNGSISFLVVGSTDCPQFAPVVPDLLRELRDCYDGPLLTHFLPLQLTGEVPYCAAADAALLTAVLNSKLEKIRYPTPMQQAPMNRFIRSAAIAFGADKKTQVHAMTKMVEPTADAAEGLLREFLAEDFEALYLFSRNKMLQPEFCRWVCERLPEKTVVFAGGQVKTSGHVNELVDAGVDFVAVGSALEGDGWEETANDLCISTRCSTSVQRLETNFWSPFPR